MAPRAAAGWSCAACAAAIPGTPAATTQCHPQQPLAVATIPELDPMEINKRTILWIVFAVSLVVLWNDWMVANGKQ